MNKIPCFVISYNRPSFLKRCVEALALEERLEIIIVDNKSKRELVNSFGQKTLIMKENFGHKVVWSDGFNKIVLEYFGYDLNNQPYIVTDCDIIVPSKVNWLDVLLRGMEKYPQYNKFGLGLNTRHIPESNKQKAQIIQHETKNIYRKKIGDVNFYEAPVDTTIALYRAGYTKYSIWGNDSELEFTGECKSVRTFAPYEAIHLTWQMTPEEIAGEENQNYIATINKNSTHWSEK